jgi:small GTP-binding protein
MGEPLKLVVVGDGAVGKTCLLVVYAKGTFPTEYVPTVFENYKCKVTVGTEERNVQLWDTAGQEELENVRVLSYPNTDVFLLCFSVVDRSSFENIKDKWFAEVNTQHGEGNPLYLLVGTKCDLREETHEGNAAVSLEDAKKLAQEIHAFDYVECSAMKNQNVKQVFDTAIQKAVTPPAGGGCCEVQ